MDLHISEDRLTRYFDGMYILKLLKPPLSPLTLRNLSKSDKRNEPTVTLATECYGS